MKKSYLIILIVLGLIIIAWSFYVFFNKPIQAATPAVKPALTTEQKTEISALLEKEKTNSLNYEEALKFIKFLNDDTTKRQFTDVSLKDVYQELKTQLETKTK